MFIQMRVKRWRTLASCWWSFQLIHSLARWFWWEWPWSVWNLPLSLHVAQLTKNLVCCRMFHRAVFLVLKKNLYYPLTSLIFQVIDISFANRLPMNQIFHFYSCSTEHCVTEECCQFSQSEVEFFLTVWPNSDAEGVPGMATCTKGWKRKSSLLQKFYLCWWVMSVCQLLGTSLL